MGYQVALWIWLVWFREPYFGLPTLLQGIPLLCPFLLNKVIDLGLYVGSRSFDLPPFIVIRIQRSSLGLLICVFVAGMADMGLDPLQRYPDLVLLVEIIEAFPASLDCT